MKATGPQDRPQFDLHRTLLLTEQDRKAWSARYQRVLSPHRREYYSPKHRRRTDGVACDTTRMEFAQTHQDLATAFARATAWASRYACVFCVINQHHNGWLDVFLQSPSHVGFAWRNPWRLIDRCPGKRYLDLGLSRTVGRHVLLLVDTFDMTPGAAWGQGTLVDAQDFCWWMKTGTLAEPYPWTGRAPGENA